MSPIQWASANGVVPRGGVRVASVRSGFRDYGCFGKAGSVRSGLGGVSQSIPAQPPADSLHPVIACHISCEPSLLA